MNIKKNIFVICKIFFFMFSLHSKDLTKSCIYNFLIDIILAEDIDLLHEYLSSHKIDLNKQNSSGNTLLHYAARTGNLNIARYLVKKGASFNIKNKQGEDAIDVAKTAEIMNFFFQEEFYQYWQKRLAKGKGARLRIFMPYIKNLYALINTKKLLRT